MNTETNAAAAHNIASAIRSPPARSTISRANDSTARVRASTETISRISTTVITAGLEKPPNSAVDGTSPIAKDAASTVQPTSSITTRPSAYAKNMTPQQHNKPTGPIATNNHT